ncbi:MAG TPA: CHAT domain-containing protein [Terriglobales bacterium]|nr:CHAT domain-containing protein [Terriglobales bacterium]
MQARRSLMHGDLIHAQELAQKGQKRFATSSPVWANKFRLLEAETLLVRGMYPQVLALLQREPDPTDKNSVIETLAIKGAAQARLHQFSEAEKNLSEAERLCTVQKEDACGEVLRAQGVFALQQGQPARARQIFQNTLAFARERGDRFLEATVLLNLGLGSLSEGHYDEAIDWTDAAFQAASSLNAEVIAIKALGNLGWAYYNLGDPEKSLEFSLAAEKRAIEAGDVIDQLSWITNAGYVYQQLGDFPRATQSYLRALELARNIHGKKDVYNSLRALALVSQQSGALAAAQTYSDEAIAIARTDSNRQDELYPLLVKGLIAAETRNDPEAERIFSEVRQDGNGNASLRWRAEHGLARLYEHQRRFTLADAQYRAALATFESARSSLKRDESKLPFASNAASIYDDYVHFLVAGGQVDAALGWIDYGRARALADGLGMLTKSNPTGRSALLAASDGRTVARRSKCALLYYWLGERESYLWLITPQKVKLFPLPPRGEIEAAAQRYHQTLLGPQDPLQAPDRDGQWLYTTLVAPTRSLLENSKVFIIPDGNLNNLNFETLIVAEPKPHFWIEDVTLANASSLRLLAAASRSSTRPPRERSLLLIGNSNAPNEKYPALAKAADQMANVAKHFPAAQKRVFTTAEATPDAYLSSSPEKFAYVHFVAHGIANRSNPLDSAIVLSRSNAQDDSFKLYARDILSHPLRAELVTVSACYGAVGRTYTAEGLVGLSWAFLRSGSHHVIAALWEVADVSTDRLMDKFYDELARGAPPDVALRNAKLSLLHSEYHNAFYWGPFQLYSGS